MALNEEQLRANLVNFASRWGEREWGERENAQTFLNELFTCFGIDRLEAGAKFEHFQAGEFYDLLWPGRVLIEMKASSEKDRLAKHRVQAMGYWERAADESKGIPQPQYVVLCAFHRFEIWEPGRFSGSPRAAFNLADLPDRFETLLFLIEEEPLFEHNRVDVTFEVAGKLGELLQSLDDRGEGDPDERNLFVLQSVWAMFAEDLGEIPHQAFTRIVDELIKQPRRSSRDDLGGLFRMLNTPGRQRPTDGLYRDVPYANGQLFEREAALSLTPDELGLLREASSARWSKVEPSIFGSLLQGVLDPEKRHRLGAHYTHETEIRDVVEPTIIDPWTERIDSIETLEEAEAAIRDLLAYTVLDPACGCGNFLYVAYRALRRIEVRLRDVADDLARASGRQHAAGFGSFFPITNMHGIEIEAAAVDLARVTMWMGHKLAVREHDLPEDTLPLRTLSQIRVDDALQCEWPRADAIVGNPPYHGSQNLRRFYSDEYLDWLDRRFGAGLKDICVYWFRRASEEMKPGVRAGFVATNSVSQNRARGASLNHVVEKGGVITDAVSFRKWPDNDAVVNVSIVNWIQKPRPKPKDFKLDGHEVAGINTRLRESKLAIEEYERLPQNAGRSFQGPIPAGAFYLTPEEAKALIAQDEKNAEVVRPYLIGDDITEEVAQQPRRWIIDFGLLTLEQAVEYEGPMRLVRERVKPVRAENRRQAYRNFWWRFAEPRPGLRKMFEPLDRYIAGNAQGKRFLFCWQDASVCPSNLVNVFAFDDDFSMGVLTSSVHQAWAEAEMSTLRVDRRYTPTSCFGTFPWPDPPPAKREAVAEASRALLARRSGICQEQGLGLTDLYNLMDEGGFRDLDDLHESLNGEVAAAYGWPKRVARDPLEIRARLAELHREIVSGRKPYDPFG